MTILTHPVLFTIVMVLAITVGAVFMIWMSVRHKRKEEKK